MPARSHHVPLGVALANNCLFPWGCLVDSLYHLNLRSQGLPPLDSFIKISHPSPGGPQESSVWSRRRAKPLLVQRRLDPLQQSVCMHLSLWQFPAHLRNCPDHCSEGRGEHVVRRGQFGSIEGRVRPGVQINQAHQFAFRVSRSQPGAGPAGPQQVMGKFHFLRQQLDFHVSPADANKRNPSPRLGLGLVLGRHPSFGFVQQCCNDVLGQASESVTGLRFTLASLLPNLDCCGQSATLLARASPTRPPRVLCLGLVPNPSSDCSAALLVRAAPTRTPKVLRLGLDLGPSYDCSGELCLIPPASRGTIANGIQPRAHSHWRFCAVQWHQDECRHDTFDLPESPLSFPFPFFPFSSRGLGSGLVLFCPIRIFTKCLMSLDRCHLLLFLPEVQTALPGLSKIPGPQTVAIFKNSFTLCRAFQMCLLPCPIVSLGHSSYLLGTRVGEASNPGPHGQTEITFAVINPTAILNKASTVAEVNAHVVLATFQTQLAMRMPFQRLGYKCYWSRPVPEQQQVKVGLCKRGLSTGTAVFSRLPSRGAIQPFAPEQDASCRISECFVRVGSIEIKVIVVYGWPSSTPEAAVRNNLLLAWAYERATSCTVPALIGGDFNMLPQSLPVWEMFEKLGWVEVGQFAEQAFRIDLPMTCKGSTRHDTFILPPVLQQFFASADVLTEAMLFDSHAPLRIKLSMPGEFPQSLHWKLPKTFADFQITSEEIDRTYKTSACRDAFHDVTDQEGPAALLTWSAAIEASVSNALNQKSKEEPHLQWPSSLPRAYRGRCRERQRVARTAPQLPRQARAGQPQVQAETTSVRARQKIRQWRRLHVLQQGIRKLQNTPQGDGYTVLLRNLLLQWKAIRAAPGYAPNFSDWTLSWPELCMLPLTLPELDLVCQLLDIVRFDYEAFAQQEASIKRNMFRYQVEVDAKGRSASPSFARIKPPPPEQLRQVFKNIQGPFEEVECHNWSHRTFSFAAADSLLVHQPVQLAGVSAQLYKASDGQIRVAFSADEDIVIPKKGWLVQEQFDCTPQGIASELINYWSEFWNRDSRREEWDIEAWPQFQALLQGQTSPCNHISVNMQDLPAWVHATRRLPKKKATGVCGWHNLDLRVLPEAALRDLASILNSPGLSGFPPELMVARVAVLGKVSNPTSPSQSRPITVLSNLYRLWARVFCQQVLLVWSYSLPPCIRGCLRGRSAQDISYWLQQVAETNILADIPCSGLVLDLRKAFNLLPRAPIGYLMQVLGVPADQVSFWLFSLSKLRRTFQVNNHLSTPLHSTTGVPEGDPISVLGMIGFCWLYVELLRPYVDPTAYVDNLAWSTELQEAHGPAMDQLQCLMSATKTGPKHTSGRRMPPNAHGGSVAPAFSSHRA